MRTTRQSYQQIKRLSLPIFRYLRTGGVRGPPGNAEPQLGKNHTLPRPTIRVPRSTKAAVYQTRTPRWNRAENFS